ncbi:hypothetical protein [Candidatus Poriferisodalis sp.]|uniref:hypothetical protein n=1 Tax=Candidatus Poriferisodalis sp. TaxID=3101277 RepID=UPI003B594961
MKYEDRDVPERVLVLKTADEYREKGYDVSLESTVDILSGYRADLVARKDDQVRVVEVRRRSSLKGDPRIRELARAVEAKPGWSLDLVLVAEPEKLDSPVDARPIDSDGVMGRIAEAEALIKSGHPESAFLIAWSACEAVVRILLADEGVSDDGITHTAFVLDLATKLGAISRAEHRHLTDFQRCRNAIVHGFSHNEFNDDLVSELIGTVRGMLASKM